jgi:hypothetical protein
LLDLFAKLALEPVSRINIVLLIIFAPELAVEQVAASKLAVQMLAMPAAELTVELAMKLAIERAAAME